MKSSLPHSIKLGARRVDYRLVTSPTARKLRVRVGPKGVEVLRPSARPAEDVGLFLRTNADWILNELERADMIGRIRRSEARPQDEILFRGKTAKILVEMTAGRRRENRVFARADEIVIQCSPCSRTTAARSLENWMRAQARQDIQACLATVTKTLKREPHRIYVMGQRTKWGNCSRKRNLSFNWRLIMAPPEVLNYIVIHEAAHLVEPYHSPKFWLLLRSHCPRFESAKNWLHANSKRLFSAIS